MKKRILALSLAAAMLVGAMASCSAKEEVVSSTPVETRDITLTLWGSEQDQAFLKEASAAWAEKYAAEHEDISSAKVDVQIKGEDVAATDANNDITAAADVFGVASDQIKGLADANAIYQIPESVANDIKEIVGDNTTFSASYWDGTCYGIPYTDNTAAILYYDNTVITAEEAKSLNTILEKGKLATEVGGGWHDMMWLATAGTTFFQGDNKADINVTADTAKMLAWVAAQVKDGKIVDVGGADDAAALAADGQVAAVIHGAWAADKFQKAFGDKYGAAELPNVTVEGSGITDAHMKCWGGCKLNVINANTKEPEAAMSLALEIVSLDNQVKRFEMRQLPPASPSLLDKVSSNPTVAADVAQSNYALKASPLNNTSGYWGEIGGIMDEIAGGKLTEEADIQAKLDAAVTTMTENVNK